MATPATEVKLDQAKADAAAEKAYAAAAQQVEAKVETAAKPALKPAAKAVAAPKAAAKKPVATKKAAAPKPAAAKKLAPKKIAKAAPMKVAAKTTSFNQIKDTIMAKTQTTTEDFTAKVKDVVADAQDRAKLAFEKSQALFGDVTEFNKGNVEALVESGKILAAGLQELGKDYVAEGKTAIETVTADVKELASVKSPTDFFKLQGEILRRNFDAAVASGSKHSETIVKLANEAFAPLSSRASVAIEKVKQAA